MPGGGHERKAVGCEHGCEFLGFSMCSHNSGLTFHSGSVGVTKASDYNAMSSERTRMLATGHTCRGSEPLECYTYEGIPWRASILGQTSPPQVFFSYLNPKFMKRQSFKLGLERYITSVFHQRFLGFCRKVA